MVICDHIHVDHVEMGQYHILVVILVSYYWLALVNLLHHSKGKGFPDNSVGESFNPTLPC